MLLFLSIFGIFLSAILFIFNLRKYQSTKYLGLFFFLVSLYDFTQYVIFNSKSIFLVAVFFINIGFLSYLIGPMLYWYIRSVLTDCPKLKRSDFWHFLPMILFLLASLPHTFMPWADKIEIAGKIIDNPEFISEYRGNILYEIFPTAFIYLSRPILVLGYLLWSMGLLISYKMKNKDKEVLSQQHFMTIWLYVLLGTLFLLVFSHMLLILETQTSRNINVFLTLNIFQIMSLAGLLGLLISPFFFPNILYGLPRFAMPQEETIFRDKEALAIPDETKKQAHKLETEYLISIGMKIDFYMEEFRPYLQSDFNLNQLSVLIQIPVHHLIYYFREIKKKHFHEYRNTMRIDFAKELIRQGKAKGITVEGIGVMAGFNNRNSFFNAFKKAEGISPGMYIDQNTSEYFKKTLS
jgi:AraC-like DNA-binding protein